MGTRQVGEERPSEMVGGWRGSTAAVPRAASGIRTMAKWYNR